MRTSELTTSSSNEEKKNEDEEMKSDDEEIYEKNDENNEEIKKEKVSEEEEMNVPIIISPVASPIWVSSSPIIPPSLTAGPAPIVPPSFSPVMPSTALRQNSLQNWLGQRRKDTKIEEGGGRAKRE